MLMPVRMPSQIADFLNHAQANRRFRPSWFYRNDATGDAYRQGLARIEQFRIALRSDWRDSLHPHALASGLLRSQFATLPERDFPEAPAAGAWIQLARDPARLRSLWHAGQRLSTEILRLAALDGKALAYGCIKPQASVERKIRLYRTGRAELDLWDLVRFRIVVPTVHLAYRVAELVATVFVHKVERLRNYYQNPREGAGDAYRGVHFELRLPASDLPSFLELQVLTLGRDVVGKLDHGVVREKASGICLPREVAWLRYLSYAANILDAARLDTVEYAGLRPVRLRACGFPGPRKMLGVN